MSKVDGMTLYVRLPPERGIWIQDLTQCVDQLFDTESAARVRAWHASGWWWIQVNEYVPFQVFTTCTRCHNVQRLTGGRPKKLNLIYTHKRRIAYAL